MVFSSLFFLYGFLPLLFLFYFLSKRTSYRNGVLIAASLLFYAWGEPVWILLLLLCGLNGYWFARYIHRHRGTRRGKWLTAAAVSVNLAILGFFKYADFLIANLNLLPRLDLPYTEVALPIGISFFTFQMMSYLVDVYRGDVKQPGTFTHVLLYVSLFPQLIAGPIVRYRDIEHEFQDRRFSWPSFSEGITRFVIGLGKKVILANGCGELAPLFLDNQLSEATVLGAWFGILLFALQIYFDFSGYSDMAIGLGKMVGFTYPENFNYPYISRSATEFWRRWNMSLGSFFRDYVYIPLGGNRRWQARNLFIVWFLTGLWHGASWNFIFWGLYFGFLIYIEKLFLLRLLSKLPAFMSHIYATAAMLVGWVFFYFTDMSSGIHFFKTLLGLDEVKLYNLELQIYVMDHLFFLIVAIIACTPLPKRIADALAARLPAMERLRPLSIPLFNAAILFVSTTMLVGSTYNPFLYFRF
ncbi:MBOAT family protein [Paenibacillus sp. J5C_2022]|uniref:MBOAT family O-acyltransferase n=1 Tax=Paenibacillus sp. J5C2022 TaxID=2977129 RepID=UPI0021D00E8B|nr:MBOAT family O-acyltransferase [Paenibacillus sp. J5C2022]MCU6710349.1 MBOAT family protein [Paenibacillus sp. J5C2022]